MKPIAIVCRWIDARGQIPWWARKLWPTLHWCLEQDGLLTDETPDFCHCLTPTDGDLER